MKNTDVYHDTQFAVDRLKAEYDIHKSLIVALDFDDTIFDFHGKGFTYPRVEKLIRRCSSHGFKIVLFTGTHPDKWPDQVAYLSKLGITVEPKINSNPIPLPFGNHGKMYYNILLDDRAGLGQACEILDGVLNLIEVTTHH